MEWCKRHFGGCAVLILPAAVFLIWLSPWDHRELFCKADEACVREWISALSGWVAALAAYVTIRTMNGQRAEANRHQRENVELEIMGRLALTRKLLAGLLVSLGACTETIARLRSEAVNYPREFARFPDSVKAIEEAMKSPVIDEYAERIGFDYALLAKPLVGRADRLIEEIGRYRTSYNLYPIMSKETLERDGPEIAAKIIQWNIDCIGYLNLLIEDAKAFNAKWRGKITEAADITDDINVARSVGER